MTAKTKLRLHGFHIGVFDEIEVYDTDTGAPIPFEWVGPSMLEVDAAFERVAAVRVVVGHYKNGDVQKRRTAMLDPTEALKHIRILVKVAETTDDAELMHRQLKEISAIIEKALKPDEFRKQVL